MTFALWPAIDLKAGKCVRLLHGEMASAQVYADDPAAQAVAFAQMGFAQLHLVDLDGAFAGAPRNAAAVAAIRAASPVRMQLGGGIRTLETVARWLDLGIDRVIIGTAAVTDPDFVTAALARWPGQVVLGLDARDGFVAVAGWDGRTALTPAAVLARYDRAALAGIVFTDIGRDGALAGVNIDATLALADAAAGVPVLASGGAASLADVEALHAAQHRGIAGMVLGRALYEGRIDPAEARRFEVAP